MSSSTKKRKNKIYLVLLVLLTFLAIFLIYKNSNSTIKQELKDFAISDTSAIVKIFMADKAANKVMLERKDTKWFADNQYEVRNDLMMVLLGTIKEISIIAPISKAEHNNAIKRLSATSTKIEIYLKKYVVDLFGFIHWFPYTSLEKTYYVGGPTQDHLGTYALIENSATPFIVYVPGFDGFLTTRYSAKLTDWRNRSIFKYDFNEIKSISVENMANRDSSFIVENLGKRQVTVKNFTTKTPIENIDTAKVLDFITGFYDVNYDEFDAELSKKQVDSIIATTPINIVSVTDVAGSVNSIKVYLRKNPGGILNSDGKPETYDVDRLFALINDGKDLVIIQYFVFDKILKTVRSFQLKNKPALKSIM